MCPRWQEVPPGPQHSYAGGLSQALFCVSCRKWFLRDHSNLVPVRGIGLVEKVCVHDSELGPALPWSDPTSFLELVHRGVCVHISMYVAVLWLRVSCSWSTHTYISRVWVFLHPCVCLRMSTCVALPVAVCMCARPLHLPPGSSTTSCFYMPGLGPEASESLSMLGLMIFELLVPRKHVEWCLVQSICHQGWASLLFTLTPRVCLH